MIIPWPCKKQPLGPFVLCSLSISKSCFPPKTSARCKRAACGENTAPEWVWEGWAEAAGSGALDRGVRRISAGRKEHHYIHHK